MLQIFELRIVKFEIKWGLIFFFVKQQSINLPRQVENKSPCIQQYKGVQIPS